MHPDLIVLSAGSNCVRHNQDGTSQVRWGMGWRWVANRTEPIL